MNSEDKEYIVIEEDGPIKLQNRINEWFHNGYLPDGPIVGFMRGSGVLGDMVLIQRMVKKPNVNYGNLG